MTTTHDLHDSSTDEARLGSVPGSDGTDNVPLTEILSGLWRASPWIALSIAFTVTAVVLWLRFVAVPTYTAHMTVAPFSEASSGSDTGRAGNIVALLAGGVAVGGPSYSLYIETRGSITVASRLMQSPDVRSHIFHSEWDSKAGKWVPPHGPLGEIKQSIKEALGFPKWSPPDASDLATLLNRRVKSSQDLQRGSYTFTFSDRDPVFAAALLTQIHDLTEEVLRDAAAQRSSIQIDHLLAALSQNTIAQNRAALAEILLQQQQQLIRINPGIPYAAIVVDPSTAGHKPTFPKPGFSLLLAVLVPGLLGVAFTSWRVRNSWRSKTK